MYEAEEQGQTVEDAYSREMADPEKKEIVGKTPNQHIGDSERNTHKKMLEASMEMERPERARRGKKPVQSYGIDVVINVGSTKQRDNEV